MENLKTPHPKEVSNTHNEIESMRGDREKNVSILEKSDVVETQYLSKLQKDKEGTKVNSIKLKYCKSTNAEEISNHIIHLLYKDWRSTEDFSQEEKIGKLSGKKIFND